MRLYVSAVFLAFRDHLPDASCRQVDHALLPSDARVDLLLGQVQDAVVVVPGAATRGTVSVEDAQDLDHSMLWTEEREGTLVLGEAGTGHQGFVLTRGNLCKQKSQQFIHHLTSHLFHVLSGS